MGALTGAVKTLSSARKASRDFSSLSMEQLQGHLTGLSDFKGNSAIERVMGRNKRHKGLVSSFTNEINRRKALQQTQSMQGVNENISGIGDRVSNLEATVEEMQGGGGAGAVGDVASSVGADPIDPVPTAAPVNTGMPGLNRAFKVMPGRMASPFSPESTIAMTSVFGTEDQRNKSIKR